MTDQNHYIEMMLKSLEKKHTILEELYSYCKEQTVIINDETVNWEKFDECIEKKQDRIDELLRLDEGFQTLYDRIYTVFFEHKEQYCTVIEQMQKMIQRITDLSIQVQTEEERNRQVIEKKLLYAKKDIKQSKISVKAATDYYKSMSRINFVDPQFMDRKH